MAGSKTDFFELEVLRIATGQTGTLTLPITPYLALFTVAPTDSSAGTEATGGGYARVNVSGKFAAPSGGSVSNDEAVSFTTFTGTVSGGSDFVGWGLFDASTGGNMLYGGTIDYGVDPAKNGTNGDTITLPVGAITLSES